MFFRATAQDIPRLLKSLIMDDERPPVLMLGILDRVHPVVLVIVECLLKLINPLIRGDEYDVLA